MPTRDKLVTAADEVNPLLTAAEIMTAAPRTCSKFSTVVEAVLIFRDADCGVVPVVDDGSPIGILTDRDVALALAEYQDALAGASVEEIMTRDVATVPSDARLDAITALFAERRIRRVLVVDGGGKVVGVIAWEDLAPHASARGMGHVVQSVVDER